MKIYALKCPREKRIRYIGKTNNIERRLYQHIWKAKKEGRKEHLYAWIKSLLNENKKPEVIILEDNLNPKEAIEREIFWISQYKNLLNMDRGGKGWGIGNQIWRGRKHCKKYKIEMSKKMKNHEVSVETRKKMSKAKRKNRGNSDYKSKLNRGIEAKKVIVYDYETKKKLYTFDSILECSKVLNLNRSYIKKRAEEKKPYINYLIKITNG